MVPRWIRKSVAGGVIALAVPLVIGVGVDPYAHRGPVETWLLGATIVGATYVTAWALQELCGAPEATSA